ncbi:hypothetical protein TrLO_g10839 [Triparma laevis f. longispina]|uniref:Uncharacterized protein n=1 Tax=Triparma laevis f. longispina TaxID=1714387 RepID=A0A9W7FRH6_9STRA|nr:hypothetical protein TrLO_g10839 [Triparma laevis f. longispina]
MADKDAEIEKLRAEVLELRKGLKDMAGDMGNMQKEFASSPNPSTVNPSTTLSLSSSSKGDDESSAVSSIEEKKPTTSTSNSSTSSSSKSSKSSTKPAAKPVPAPFKPAEIDIGKGEEGSLGEASTMSQSGVGEGVGFVLSPDPKKVGGGGTVGEPALQQSQSKLFTLSDSEDSQSLGQSVASSSIGMSNSGVSDSLSVPSKIA